MKKYVIVYGGLKKAELGTLDGVREYLERDMQSANLIVDLNAGIKIVESLDEGLNIPLCSCNACGVWVASRYVQDSDYVIKYSADTVKSDTFRGTLVQAMEHANSKISEYRGDVEICPIVDGELLPPVCDRLWMGDFVVSDPDFPGYNPWQTTSNI